MGAFGQGALAPPSIRLATRQFQSPGQPPYLEVQAEFMAEGLSWLSSSDSTWRAAAQWTVIAYDSTGTVAGFAKSTARTGNLPERGDFVDVMRIELLPGPHVLELEVTDVGNAARPKLTYETNVGVTPVRPVDISDLFVVQAVAPASEPPSPLTRSGKDILPLIDNRVSAEASRVAFYGELYGTSDRFGDGGGFFGRRRLSRLRAGTRPGSRRPSVIFRKTAAPVVPVLEALPPPPPGTYELVVQVMTPDQGLVVGSSLMLEVISSTTQDAAVAAGTLAPFVLEHGDRDSLLSMIETLLPIADAGERRSNRTRLERR